MEILEGVEIPEGINYKSLVDEGRGEDVYKAFKSFKITNSLVKYIRKLAGELK